MLVLLTVIGSISGIATAMLLWPLGWLIALTCMPLGASLAVALADSRSPLCDVRRSPDRRRWRFAPGRSIS